MAMNTKEKEQEAKALAKKLIDNKAIAIVGHNSRIKEQRKIIADAKRSIKMHKLLIKQAKLNYKLKSLEV